ncbi:MULTISPECIES: zinc ABC transporter substrate-binding protein ZnuA [Pasteurellaceae]|uniref:High-affinity zinc uptake system protein ZnuA n=1 Tax=Pasteurella atlantica TaxID=2827233 RepID=A0AAW8CSL9_9PAST|nr:zinc ABC transporter substrate-binding protein ZnuA [Pasteurella atlantica]MBR0574592.1 zinc ABC transporter substrate-binding protein ZnuA [Pasteurella atlantica]MDP8040499.1 zinc ABC transporter substrate-binding protein ZnuA [Pasteurella atlantica]MDP8042640.1 zinc ABC transporter substrate-binding protein ZnuA [Pasteurella atlantica]MDP8044743.1 zinc ABC transporter substrate-binding protein ZnuA [Pasteurella atlantica]MDP8046815.1 zinc ABC transporter substrate-binding protein ZnuA [Pa
MLKKTTLSLAILGMATVTHANVLTTIKPLGFIANAITDGVTETDVLLPTSASPHDYSLKPSDVQKLKSASLVVWIGDEMETFLEKSIEKLPQSYVLTLESIPEIKEIVEHTDKRVRIKLDEKHHNAHKHHHHNDEHEHHSEHEHHDDNDEHKHHDKHEHHNDNDEHEHHAHHHHHHHNSDWHIWVSPKMSSIIAEQIAKRLSEKLPAKKTKIEANLTEFKLGLAKVNIEIAKQLLPVKDKGYYTFHAAYGYFEDAYGLKSLGAFTMNPTVAPGAKTLEKIKANIKTHQATCLFTEPQFTPKVVERLSKGVQVGVGRLDPLGGNIKQGKTAYLEYLRSLATAFEQCLSK